MSPRRSRHSSSSGSAREVLALIAAWAIVTERSIGWTFSIDIHRGRMVLAVAAALSVAFGRPCLAGGHDLLTAVAPRRVFPAPGRPALGSDPLASGTIPAQDPDIAKAVAAIGSVECPGDCSVRRGCARLGIPRMRRDRDRRRFRQAQAGAPALRWSRLLPAVVKQTQPFAPVSSSLGARWSFMRSSSICRHAKRSIRTPTGDLLRVKYQDVHLDLVMAAAAGRSHRPRLPTWPPPLRSSSGGGRGRRPHARRTSPAF
jgi:hypothetical protein